MSKQERVFEMKFSSVYPFYVQKAQKKDRTQAEVDRIICWLTGYTQAGLEMQLGVIVFFLQIDTLGPKNVKRDKHLQNRLFEVPCAFGAN